MYLIVLNRVNSLLIYLRLFFFSLQTEPFVFRVVINNICKSYELDTQKKKKVQ